MSEIDRFILWGGTGQAKVVRPILEPRGKVIAVFDDTVGLKPPFNDVPLYCGWNGFLKWRKENLENNIGFCIAIGNPHGNVRVAIAEKLKKQGLKPVSVVHESAVIESGAVYGEGVQVMAGAVICSDAIIGEQCIINTNASVDHECVLEDGCEVAPGATLCGNIHMKSNSWVCAGATILPRITIGENSIVGAGAVVIHDVPDNTIVAGVPAKYLRGIK